MWISKATTENMLGLPKFTSWPILVLLLALAIPAPVFAQGCAMCYQNAAASGTQGINALRNGILILLFPPIFISMIIGVFAYTKRNQFNAQDRALTSELDGTP